MHIDHVCDSELQALQLSLEEQYAELAGRQLSLDLTRGKPGTQQVALSSALDGILAQNFNTSGGNDVRNYGGLEGLPEARSLFGSILGLKPRQTLVGGNSSLTMMYQTVDFLLREGINGPATAWEKSDTVKFLCPTPGYDRHFSICEHLGIEMRSVRMLASGPDMDVVEALVQQDPTFKGIWCVPRFSNPTGCVYSDETVERLAKLPLLAGDNFAVMWDNAYALHTLYGDAPKLASIAQYCQLHGTLDQIFQFGSTSKITFAGSGVAFMGSSEATLSNFCKHLSYRSIGPDKVNQLRHLRFLPDIEALSSHMARHADIIRPRFEAVLTTLQEQLGDSGMGSWTVPRGGYFISFDTLPGLARKVVQLAHSIGVKLTPAGATFPYGKDPLDSNIRLAPTFPSAEDVQATVDAFVVCVKLATVRQRLQP